MQDNTLKITCSHLLEEIHINLILNFKRIFINKIHQTNPLKKKVTYTLLRIGEQSL
jgi:hypothetical protein